MVLAIFSTIIMCVSLSLSLKASSIYGALPVCRQTLCLTLYTCHLIIIPIFKMGKLSLKTCTRLSASPAPAGLWYHP